MTRRKTRAGFAIAALGWLAFAAPPAAAAEFEVTYRAFPVMKSVFGQVQSRDTVAARARIGGTVVEITVEEGNAVSAGDTIANVVDQKLALQLEAIEARQLAISAQLDNARTNLERTRQLFQRGTIAKTRLDEMQTQFSVLENELSAVIADKAVISRQAEEGSVLAPSSGRVLSVPVTAGSVILPGETVARIAGGGYFLRLLLPERHAAGITENDIVTVGARGLFPQSDAKGTLSGRIAKVYPEILNGRVTADVEVDGLGDFFVGERTLVSLPIGERRAIAVPAGAITTRHGIDYVTVVRDGERAEITVVPGEPLETDAGRMMEVLTGLRAGDRVVLP